MREIKFRAWDKHNKTLKYEGFDIDPTGNIWINQFSVKEQLEVMQFTGLKDKNGVEIYEGDIVKHAGYYGDWHRSVVSYGSGYWYPLVNVEEGHNAIDKYYPDDYEVIGNIYSNPELLEAK